MTMITIIPITLGMGLETSDKWVDSVIPILLWYYDNGIYFGIRNDIITIWFGCIFLLGYGIL